MGLSSRSRFPVSCFVLSIVLCYHVFAWRVCLFVFFLSFFFVVVFKSAMWSNHQVAVPLVDNHHSRVLADSLPDVSLARRASSTTIKYSVIYARWKRWARDHGLPAFPASPYDFALYLPHLIADAKTTSAIKCAVHSIAWVHHLAGERSPSEHPLVKDVLAGARRFFGPQYFQGTYYRC